MSNTPGCHRREAWGGCHCKTPAQVSTCMYRPGKPGEPTPNPQPIAHAAWCPASTPKCVCRSGALA